MLRRPSMPFFALAAAVFAGPGLSAQGTPPPPPTAFVDVSVVDPASARILPGRTVVVRGGVIAAVGARDRVDVPPDARRVEGRGGFLIPGLVDAHVHIMEGSDLGRFLHYGVTTVRHLTGSDEVLAWRDDVARGVRLGPRIVTSGPLMAGPEIPWEDKVTPADPAAAREEVRRQRDRGYDLIKIYDGLEPDVYAAVVDEAARLGIPTTGHIPASVGLDGVLGAGQDLEHTDKLVMDVWGHDLDAGRIDEVAERIRRAGVAVTPTLATMEQMARIRQGGFDSLLARPEARRVGPETLGFWCGVSARLRGDRSPAPGVRFDPFADFQIEVVGALSRAEVPLLAGTDYPNAMLAAGSGLLEEVRAMARAGLSPADALEAATRPPPGAPADPPSGTVAAGARADLVLLRENPLEDLSALDRRVGVMAAGRWLDGAELARIAPAPQRPPTCPGPSPSG